MKNSLIKSWQKRTFVLCWTAYTLAYLARLNLSVAIPLLEENVAFAKTSLGLIGSSFFWVYAFGQLINGRLGDKFKSRSFVFIGLLMSAIVNILFVYANSLVVMTILWALNGFFQSILWGPLIKTLHQWFPKKERPKVALNIFTSVIVGFLLTWGFLAQIVSYIGWKSAFQIPGIILIVYSLIWLIFIRDRPEDLGLTPIDKGENRKKSSSFQSQETKNDSFAKLFFQSKIYIIALAGIPLGFIREGISLWGPTLLYETFQLNLSSTMGAALLIPLFNFLGVIVARLLITRFINRENKLLAYFFIGATFTCILLYFFQTANMLIYILLLALCSLFLYGGTSILTSVIPLKYPMPSSVAGFLDFSIYLGAGLSGIITGFVSAKFGWNIVILIWVLVGILGILSVKRTVKKQSKNSLSFLINKR